MTDKIDVKTEIDAYGARAGRFSMVDVPDLQYLMIDGHGDPNTDRDFTEAVAALSSAGVPVEVCQQANPWTRLRRHAPGRSVVG
jgi:hypothetical protein